MIKNDIAYQKSLQKLETDKEYIEKEHQRLSDLGLEGTQLEMAIQPLISFHEQLQEEVAYYERVKKGEFNPIHSLSDLGKNLIAYRIYKGMTQAELASRLNVSESQVSRDERHEYYGATTDKLERVMKAMEMTTVIHIELSLIS